MDPVEKVITVLPRLAARPHLVEKRNGAGNRYHVLRRWVRSRGAKGRKDDIYLGRLTPLQRLAVQQVIRDAGKRDDRINANRHLRLIYAQMKEHRRGRAILSVLAQRAGYRLHGYTLRKSMNKTGTERPSNATAARPGAMPSAVAMGLIDATTPVASLLEGLKLAQALTERQMAHSVIDLLKRAAKPGYEECEADRRIVRALLRQSEHSIRVEKEIARLEGGRSSGADHG